MNQQFIVEYLDVKSSRYNRLPNLNNNHYLNLSQEQRISRTNKHHGQIKLHALSNKKDESNNCCNHTTIYNVKENKNISKASNNQESSFLKYNQLQTKLMVSDFKNKVDAFLKKNNYNTIQTINPYKPNLISSKITSSLKELILPHQIINEELLNKSLCSNKYTVKTEKKSMKAIEIFILGNNKVVTKEVISNDLLQHRLLKKMETFLKDDRFNYDLKMTTMIEQYSEIVNRINQKAFTIKIPEKYIIQMSDYNEYYQIKEDQTDIILQDKLEIIADQIIQEIQQSKIATPKIKSNRSSGVFEPIIQNTISQIEKIIQTEPNIVHEQEEVTEQEIVQLQQIVPERKISNRKSRQKKKNQQNKNERNQSEQSSVSDILDSSLKNSTIKINEDNKKKRKEKSKIADQAKIEEEEQDLQQKEIEKQKKLRFIKKLREFNQLYKPNIFSRRQSEIHELYIEDPIILEQPKEKIVKTFSLGSQNDTLNMKEINEIIRIKKKQLYEYQQEQLRQEKQQNQIIENFIQNKNNGQQKPLNLIVNGKHINDLKETVEMRDSKRNSPRSYTKQRQNVQNSNITEQTLKEQQQSETNNNLQKNNKLEQQDKQIESTKALQQNNNKRSNHQQIKQVIKQLPQDIFDILLASDSVYDVKIDEYKIGKPGKDKISHPDFIFQQEQDEVIFTNQVLWRREIQQVIPKLNFVNKQMQVQIDSEDEYLNQKLTNIDEEDFQDDDDDDDENSQI